MKYSKYIFLTTLLTATFLTGCNEDLLETVPNDRVSTAIYWKTTNDATMAANAIYRYIDGVTYWDGMSDIGHVTLQWRTVSIHEKGAYDATLDVMSTEWTNNYTAIRAANAFMDNVGNIPVTTANKALLDRLTAEVRALRAYFYSRLAFLWGDVPLIKTSITLAESKEVPRAPVATVWDFISTEFTDAAAILPVAQAAADKGRVTKGAALGLKARAMLYAGRYTEAAAAAKAVMDLNAYSLYPTYATLFSYAAENNAEIIFDKQFIKDVYPNDAFAFLGSTSQLGGGQVVPTKLLVDAFEMKNGKAITDPTSGFDPRNPYANRDPRLKYSVYVLGETLPDGKIYNSKPGSGTADAIGYSENSTATGFNCRKYVNKEDAVQRTNCGINIIRMRFAEILLIYAEAKIEANQIDLTVADAINRVRQRPDVAMPPISVGTQAAMRAQVRNERLVELSFEDLRYFDIRRWKIAQDLTGPIMGMTYVDANNNLVTVSIPSFVKVFRSDRDYLWPVPFREMNLNLKLAQNPNW